MKGKLLAVIAVLAFYCYWKFLPAKVSWPAFILAFFCASTLIFYGGKSIIFGGSRTEENYDEDYEDLKMPISKTGDAPSINSMPTYCGDPIPRCEMDTSLDGN